MASRTALVVEDDPDIRRLIRKYLEKLDVEVREAGTGKAALAALAAAVPGLVCLDLMLPESSGYEICEHIRKTPALSAVPVVVISARSMPPDRAEAEAVGADAYLIKPIRWKTFSATVLSLLDGTARP
jgi:two-component system chemotaxis response regulator CheY